MHLTPIFHACNIHEVYARDKILTFEGNLDHSVTNYSNNSYDNFILEFS